VSGELEDTPVQTGVSFFALVAQHVTCGGISSYDRNAGDGYIKYAHVEASGL
jgi:hypothetical protein